MTISLKNKGNLKERADLLRSFLNGDITSQEFDSKQSKFQKELDSNFGDSKVKRTNKKTGSISNKSFFKSSSGLSDEELKSIGRSSRDLKIDYHSKDGKKVCSCCNKEISIDYFHSNSLRADGLDVTCKTCKQKRLNFAKTQNIKLRNEDIQNNISKVCKGCSQLKPITDFHQALTSFRGSSAKCKCCI